MAWHLAVNAVVPRGKGHTPTQKFLDLQAAGSVTDSQRLFLGLGWWVFPAIPEGNLYMKWVGPDYAAEKIL